MNRHVTAFKQLLSDTELNLFCQVDAEEAMNHLISDISIFGVITGGVVSEHSTPNMSVDLTGPCVAYNQAGQRCYMGTAQVLDCTYEYLGAATVPTVPGDHRWVSVHLRFDRLLSDMRLDGNDPPVPYYWSQAESFELRVISGLAGPAPARPAKPSDAILLCDIDMVTGMTAIANADIYTDRRDEFQWLPASVVTVDDSAWTKIAPADNVQEALDNVEAMIIARNGSGGITETPLLPSVDGGVTLGSAAKSFNGYFNDLSVSDSLSIDPSIGYLAHRYDRLSDGIQDRSAGDEFTVNAGERFVVQELEDMSTAAGVYSTACDGVRVFVGWEDGSSTHHVSAYTYAASTWSRAWDYETTDAVNDLCCDGARVFVAGAWVGSDNVLMLNAATGARICGVQLASSATAKVLACDGSTLAIGCEDATNVMVKEYTYTASAMTSSTSYAWGTVASGARVSALAIVALVDVTTNALIPTVIAGGLKGGVSVDKNLMFIAGGTALKQISGSGEVWGVAATHDRIFVAHDHYEVVASSGTTEYVHCRSFHDGKVLWKGPDSTSDAVECAHDGHRLFVGIASAGGVHQFDFGASSGAAIEPEYVYNNAYILGGCDGALLPVYLSDDTVNVMPVTQRARRFVRTSDTDTNRTPGFCLAQPAE